MTDTHVHVGWFVNRYYSPYYVSKKLRKLGIESVAISSTSTCAEEYNLIIEEFTWLEKEWGNNLVPILWLTPQMIIGEGLESLLRSSIKWKVIKMHWDAHPEFYFSPYLVQNIMNDKRLHGLPVLIHTGHNKTCRASVFKDIINHYTDRLFILAHCRPLQETSTILKNSPNAFADTAFMSEIDIIKLLDNGFANKILWGTDFPITEYYNVSLRNLKNKLKNIQKKIPNKDYRELTQHNFSKIFQKSL